MLLLCCPRLLAKDGEHPSVLVEEPTFVPRGDESYLVGSVLFQELSLFPLVLVGTSFEKKTAQSYSPFAERYNVE